MNTRRQCSRCGTYGTEARGLCRRCYDGGRNRYRLASGATAANKRQLSDAAFDPVSLEDVSRMPRALVVKPCPVCGAPPVWDECLICTRRSA